MLYLIGMLGGFGLVTFFLQSLISKFGSGKNNVALKEFLDPMVQIMELMDGMTGLGFLKRS